MTHHPRSLAPRRLVARALAGLAAVALVAGCGGSDTSVVAGAEPGEVPGEVPAPPPSGELPVLPPAEERQPEVFDDAGCLVTGPGTVDCETTADEVDDAAAGASEADDRTLAGFLGSRWLEDPAGGSPLVLADTVVAGADAEGRWTATGLARNEAAAPVAGVEVRAVLVGADGAVLDTVTAVSPVTDVRVGEPVPFELRSGVDASAVAGVTWEAGAVEGDADPRARELALAIYWVRPEGAPDAVDLYLYRDPGDARPQALFASATSVGDVAVDAPRLVVAWTAADGRVLAVDEGALATPTGAALDSLAPGAAADAIVVRDGVAVPGLADATPIVWGLGG